MNTTSSTFPTPARGRPGASAAMPAMQPPPATPQPPPRIPSRTPPSPAHERTSSSGSACRYGHGSVLTAGGPPAPLPTSPARARTPTQSSTPMRRHPHPRSRSRSVGPGGRSRSQTPQSGASDDPGMLRGPGKLFRMIHYGDLLKATRDFRSALHLVARSGEVFGRVVDALADCRSPHEDDPIPHDLLADAEFLADTVRLVSGTHQLLGDMVWRDLETPMQRDLDEMNREALSICTKYNNDLVKLRPQVAKAASKLAKLRSKRKRPTAASSSSHSTPGPVGRTPAASWTEDDDPLVHAERAHAVLEAQAIRLEHEISTTGDRMAAPRIHGVIRRIGPVARGTIAGYTNLAQAVSAMTEVGHTRAATAREVGSILCRGGEEVEVEEEWMATAPHSRRTTAGSVGFGAGGVHKRTVTWATAASMASVGQKIQASVPADATGEAARRHVKTGIFSMLSTELNAAPAV